MGPLQEAAGRLQALTFADVTRTAFTQSLAEPYKLGKAPAKNDIRTARLEFFMGGLPEPPPASSGRNRALMASCDMLGNDQYGDCVVADDGHRLELWTKLTPQAGDDVDITAAETIAFYQQASIALNHSSADAGLVMLDYNKWRMVTPWRNRRFYGFGTVDHFNHKAIKQLIIAFNAIALGILLPSTAQSQPAPGGTWSIVSRDGAGRPGSWGGHDVPAIDYDEGGVYVLTWGGVQYVRWDFFDYYTDESYAIIPTEPVPGFDLYGFVTYLKSIGAYTGPIPPAPEPPAPTPGPIGPTPPSSDWVPTPDQLNDYIRKVMGPFRRMTADLDLVTENGVHWPVHAEGDVR